MDLDIGIILGKLHSVYEHMRETNTGGIDDVITELEDAVDNIREII